MKYFIISTIIFITSCNSAVKQDKAQESENHNTTVVLTNDQFKNADIATGIVEQRSLKSIVKVKGKIEVPPQNMVSISFPLGGYLKSTKLLPGMHISKGEVIAILEDQQYIQLQQDYLMAKANHLYLENEYLRQKELNKSKASSDKIYQQAEADYKSNNILISGLRQKLQLIGINPATLNENNISRTVSIHAPINGFVSDVKVNIGRYINPSDVLFELVNPTDIHLTLTVFEKDIDKLHIGQKLVAYNNNNPDKKYACKIILISQEVTPERTILVHCHFDNYDGALVPGMYMNAEIEVANLNTYVVPEEAIVRYGDKQYIFVALSNRQYEMKEVITGDTDSGFIAISHGKDINLKDATIVTKNAYTLLMTLKNTAE